MESEKSIVSFPHATDIVADRKIIQTRYVKHLLDTMGPIMSDAAKLSPSTSLSKFNELLKSDPLMKGYRHGQTNNKEGKKDKDTLSIPTELLKSFLAERGFDFHEILIDYEKGTITMVLKVLQPPSYEKVKAQPNKKRSLFRRIFM